MTFQNSAYKNMRDLQTCIQLKTALQEVSVTFTIIALAESWSGYIHGITGRLSEKRYSH